jgi:hypothetical protein
MRVAIDSALSLLAMTCRASTAASAKSWYMCRVASRLAKPVADSRSHPLDAGRLGWKQDHVVNRGEAGGCNECVDEPRPDPSVVGNGVTANRQSTRCRCSRADHHLVLLVCLTCPRSQRPLVDEREECIADHQRARLEPARQRARATVVLPDDRSRHDGRCGRADRRNRTAWCRQPLHLDAARDPG